MLRFRNQVTLIIAFALTAFMASCSENPVSSGADTGSLTLSIKGLGSAGLAKGDISLAASQQITVTSAHVVIEKVELENEANSSLDFKFDQPFVQDLTAITTLQELETIGAPFGRYDEIKVEIDDLDAEDGAVYTQNPELQDLSIRIEGFIDGDPTQAFTFTSDIGLDVERKFNPPLVVDETTASKNIVLGLDFSSWFVDGAGNFLDPAVAANRVAIERNIKNSVEVFEDDDKDGERDDDADDDEDDDEDDDDKVEEDVEFKATISALGDDYLMANDRQIFVNEATIIVGDDEQSLAFSDLAVGMFVEVHAVFQSDGSLLATKIEVED